MHVRRNADKPSLASYINYYIQYKRNHIALRGALEIWIALTDFSEFNSSTCLMKLFSFFSMLNLIIEMICSINKVSVGLTLCYYIKLLLTVNLLDHRLNYWSK